MIFHACEKILAKCRGIKWLKDLIKLYVLNLSWDAWQRGEMKPNNQVWNIEKWFLVLFSHNLSLLPELRETPLLAFLMGRCFGRAFSVSGKFTLSLSFQLENFFLLNLVFWTFQVLHLFQCKRVKYFLSRAPAGANTAILKGLQVIGSSYHMLAFLIYFNSL